MSVDALIPTHLSNSVGQAPEIRLLDIVVTARRTYSSAQPPHNRHSSSTSSSGSQVLSRRLPLVVVDAFFRARLLVGAFFGVRFFGGTPLLEPPTDQAQEHQECEADHGKS